MASTLLIATACLAANLSCATAPADDGLPRGRAEPPRGAVTACSGLGPNYVWSAATDTCIKVGGSVRVDGAIQVGR